MIAKSRGLGGCRQLWLALATAAFGMAASTPLEAAPQPTPIRTCGAVLSKPGRYVLAKDLTCSVTGFNAAIQITASNVRLNLAGNTLTGTGDGFGILVGTFLGAIPTSGVQIASGTVTGFSRGVLIEEASGANVAGVRAVGNEIGFSCDGSSRITFVGNAAIDNAANGFDLDEVCNDSRVVGNEARGNGTGFQVNEVVGTLFVGNEASQNERGFDLPNIEVKSTFIGNLVTSNTERGFGVTNAASGNRVIGNVFSGNPVDIVDIAISLGQACDNTFRANSFATDNETGAAAGPGAGCIQ